MTAETITPNSDETADSDLTGKQLDHIDQMLHECHAVIMALQPLVEHMPRLMTLLDPGSAMRRHLKRAPK